MPSSPSREILTWIVGGEGAELLRHVATLLGSGDPLSVGSALREDGIAHGRAAALTSLAATRLRARERYVDADRLLFTSELLQQASHPAVATHRADRFAGGGPVVDLCCGAGGDALAIAADGTQVLALDRDPAACLLAAYNLDARGHRSWVIQGDVTAAPVLPGPLVHIDPARRAGGRRLRGLVEYHPPLPRVLPFLRASSGAAITVSPGIDLDDPDLPGDGELEFVQVGADLVEAVIWLGDLRRDRTAATATLLGPDGDLVASLAREAPSDHLRVGDPGEWLVESAPAVVRARLHDEVGASIGARRLAEHRALLTTAEQPDPSPLYRSWRIEAVLPARAKDVRGWLRDAEELPVEIAVHGLDVDPERFVRQLGSPPRGPNARRIHLVRLDEGAAAFVTCTG